MRVFVAGGAGFIGSHYVRYLLSRGDEVTVYDLLTYRGLRENVEGIDIKFIEGDIADAAALDVVIPGHDAVVNFANYSFVDRSIRWPEEFVRHNVLGTAALVEAVRRLEIPRFLHISTDEVYGSIERGVFREGDPLQPSSPYSATKAAADLYALASHRTYGTPVVISRSCNVFGARQFPENAIPLFVTNLLMGRAIPLFGDGRASREWIAASDVCEAIHTVLEKGTAGEVYNIGTGVERANIDLATQIISLLGLEGDLITYVADRPGHDRRYAVDASKVRALGWAPERDFDEALAETVAWYRENRAWWEPLRARMES